MGREHGSYLVHKIVTREECKEPSTSYYVKHKKCCNLRDKKTSVDTEIHIFERGNEGLAKAIADHEKKENKKIIWRG